MIKRLNGWQRLWVVVSVLGLLYAVYFALDDGYRTYKPNVNVLLGYNDRECKAIVELPAGYKFDQTPLMSNPCWHLYLYRSIYKDARPTADGYVQHMGELQRSRALETFSFTLLVWFICVLLIYGAGAIMAWVVRGFRRPPHGP